MTFDQLRYFYEASKYQHVGKAAQAAHISPSAISGAIAALEVEFACPLFERKGRGIFLTDQGRYLREKVESLFEQMNGIQKGMQGEASELRGSFRLGASHFLAARFLSKAWITIQKNHPQLEAEICTLGTSKVISELVGGTLDFGLCFSPLKHADLKQIEVYEGKLELVVRKGHPILKKTPKLSDLSEYPAAMHKSAYGVDVCESHPIFDRYGIVPRTRFLFDSDESAVECLIGSNHWSLLPDVVTRAYAKQLQSVPVPKDWDATYTIAMVMRNKRQENSALQLLGTEIKKLF